MKNPFPYWSSLFVSALAAGRRLAVRLGIVIVLCVTLGFAAWTPLTAAAGSADTPPAEASTAASADTSNTPTAETPPPSSEASPSSSEVSPSPAPLVPLSSPLPPAPVPPVAGGTDASAASPSVVTSRSTSANVYVVPIKGEINRTQLFILRRALKEAIQNEIDTVVLDMDTPGGAAGVTLEMMEALQRFPGKTITYVNSEAMSAGSFISMATSEIWFAPDGIMGAAEAVSGGGQEIGEGMQRKIRSYLHAKVRSMQSESRYRADVQRAMMDPTFVLEIDGTVLSKEGELLSLTAAEAAKTYGEPPEPLLSSGTVDNVDELLDHALGAGNYTIRQYELTWSESFAKWFQALAPLLMGAGIMLLFIEFKTPGFGIVGGAGIALLLLVFGSNYFAGLAGYEALLVFLLGVALLGVEVLVVPGTLVAGGLGVLLILGSLLWAMADIWPQGAEGFVFSADLFTRPLLNLGIGLVIAVFGSILIAKLLPRTRAGRSLILSASVGGKDPLLAGGGQRSIDLQGAASPTTQNAEDALPAIGRRGIAVTPLRPSGQVEIDGRRYEARLRLGQIDKGEIVEVIGHRDFALLVQKV